MALKWWMILLLAGVTPAEKLLEMYHGPWGQCVDPVFEELLYWNIEGDWNFPVCFSSAFLHAKFSSTCSFSLLKNRRRKREKVMVIYFTVMKKTVSVYRNKLWCVRPYLEASMQPPFNIIWSNLIQLILLVWIYLNSWVTLSFQKTSLFELCIIVFSYHWLALPDKPAKFVCSTALLLA